jgi:PBSX family phage terminase large subunit
VKDKDGIIADGAIRSGKTVSMSLSYVMWAMERHDGKNFIMAGKTISSFKRNVLQNLKLMLTSRGYRWDYHISGDLPNMLEVTRKGKTNYFSFLVEKTKALRIWCRALRQRAPFLMRLH